MERLNEAIKIVKLTAAAMDSFATMNNCRTATATPKYLPQVSGAVDEYHGSQVSRNGGLGSMGGYYASGVDRLSYAAANYPNNFGTGGHDDVLYRRTNDPYESPYENNQRVTSGQGPYVRAGDTYPHQRTDAVQTFPGYPDSGLAPINSDDFRRLGYHDQIVSRGGGSVASKDATTPEFSSSGSVDSPGTCGAVSPQTPQGVAGGDSVPLQLYPWMKKIHHTNRGKTGLH